METNNPMITSFGNSLFYKVYQRINRAFQILFLGKNYWVYSQHLHSYHNLSFSQEGEDLLLKRIFEHQEKGFYVDIGAHHPQRFSNTYLFYLKGWRGINVDAMPGSMRLFEEIRPEDINIEAAISDSSELLTYYMFNESALNGFSNELSNTRNGLCNYEIVAQKSIKTQTLSDILDSYLQQGQEIDFLSIDVEGLDYRVLLSNDWSRYRPKFILIEEISISSLETLPRQSQAFYLLEKEGYEFFAKTFNTSFYRLATT